MRRWLDSILIPVSLMLASVMTVEVALAQTTNLLLRNGNIITENFEQAVAQAVYIEGNTIRFVGANAAADKFKNASTRVIDLRGRTVIPGLIESHAHIHSLGESKLNLDLSNTANYAELIVNVERAVNAARPGEWILGRGWHQSNPGWWPGRNRASGPTAHSGNSGKYGPGFPVGPAPTATA